VLEHVRAVVRTIAEQARAADPSIAPATNVDIVAITGGLSRVGTIEVLGGSAADLPRLADELVEFASAVLAKTS
jgi:hypothetical protein